MDATIGDSTRKRNSILRILLTTLCFLTLSIHSFCQENWIKYGNEPVLKRDTVISNLPNDLIAISDCWVEKEGGIYKMWYTCGGINYPADTLLRSRLCYATSTDGIVWNKHAGNPILDVSYTGGWDSLGVETACIIIDSIAPLSERYKMWYAGQYFNDYRYDIGYAVSADGIIWTKHPNPVLEVGVSSQWDNGFLEGPTVIKDGSLFKMWYCGYDASVDGHPTDGHANIGYATSVDGITWVKYSLNPVLITGINSWDSIYVQDPHVIKQNGVYHMWFGGGSTPNLYDQQVGYASSLDGINWVKSLSNPVLERGGVGDWDATIASFPSVMNDNGVYKMWYTGKDVDPLPFNSLDYFWEIGYATGESIGIDNLGHFSREYLISPNPFDDFIKIDDLKEDEIIILANYIGQILYMGSDIENQNLSALSEGLYFLTIINGEIEQEYRLIKK